MALYVKDNEVDRLAKRLSALRNVSKTEVIRQALANELEKEEARPSLVEIGVAFCRSLRARGDAARATPADKAFIDSLYGDD